MTKKNPKKQPNRFIQFSGAAFQMGIIIFVGTFIGMKLDETYPNKNNIYTLIFTLVFLFVALYSLIKKALKFSKDDE